MNVYLWLWLCVLILFVLLVVLPAYFQRRAREHREQVRIADTAAKREAEAAAQPQAHRSAQDPEGEHLRPPLWVPTTSSLQVKDGRMPERSKEPLSRSGFIELSFRPAPSRPSAAEAPRFVVGLDPFTDPASILSPLNPLSPAYSSTASCEPTPAPERTPHSSDTSAPSSPTSDTSSSPSDSSPSCDSSSGSSSGGGE